MKAWMKILLGLFAGILFGLIFKEQYQVLTVTGKIFIDLLKMLVGILVFSSIVTGICHIHDPRKLGRIGLRTMGFFVISTIIAISIGLLVSYVIKPGEGLSLYYESGLNEEVMKVGILDFLLTYSTVLRTTQQTVSPAKLNFV